jgi:hypothetical protein
MTETRWRNNGRDFTIAFQDHYGILLVFHLLVRIGRTTFFKGHHSISWSIGAIPPCREVGICDQAYLHPLRRM